MDETKCSSLTVQNRQGRRWCHTVSRVAIWAWSTEHCERDRRSNNRGRGWGLMQASAEKQEELRLFAYLSFGIDQILSRFRRD